LKADRVLRFANLYFRGLRREDLLRDDGQLKLIVTVNAEIIVQANGDPILAEIINRNWATLDGHWPHLLARRSTGRNEIEKISGSDFIYDLCGMARERRMRVFLLGASPEVNRAACEKLRATHGIEIEGYAPPVMAFPFPGQVDGDIMARISAFRPHILVVGFGAPKQEYWADAHLPGLAKAGTRWVLAAGGTLDFVAGALRRAPVAVQRAGLESLWRFALQPRTRFRRLLRALRFLQYA
jgi:N-acetylglucosaminyldiphosphoundecaprenol N-acetyl-beta-D-mannosaminyltransferase